MQVLRSFVRCLLLESIDDMWLSPRIVETLIDLYAMHSPTLGGLRWEYVDDLPGWGRFVVPTLTLRVNRAKLRAAHRDQIWTILHEIQHWNQLAAYVEQVRAVHPEYDVKKMTTMFHGRYTRFEREQGYESNPFEVDACEFADSRIERASAAAGRVFYREMVGSLS